MVFPVSYYSFFDLILSCLSSLPKWSENDYWEFETLKISIVFVVFHWFIDIFHTCWQIWKISLPSYISNMCYRFICFRFDYAARYPKRTEIDVLLLHNTSSKLPYIRSSMLLVLRNSSNPKGTVYFLWLSTLFRSSWSIFFLYYQVIGLFYKQSQFFTTCIYYFGFFVVLDKRTKMKANRTNSSRIFLRPRKLFHTRTWIDVYFNLEPNSSTKFYSRDEISSLFLEVTLMIQNL